MLITSILVFSVVYWSFTNLAFVIYFFKKHQLTKDVPDYGERVKKVKQLLDKLGYKMKFKVKSRIAFGFVIPFSRNIFISEELLRKASFSELLYVVYHEVGHKQLKHPEKLTGFFLLFLLIFICFKLIFGFSEPIFALLFALIFGNIELYLGQLYEDEADVYSLRQVGFEKVKKGLLALQRINKSKYDYNFLQGYFDVHRTHLARIDRLKAKSESK